MRRSSALRRHKNSSNSSHVGFIRYTVRFSLPSTGVVAYQFIMPAPSDWPRFSLDALTDLTPTAPVEGEGAQINPTSPSLDMPAQSNVSLAQSNVSSAQSNVSSAQSNVSPAQSNVSLDRSNALSEPQDPTQPVVIVNPQHSNPNVPALPNPTLGRSDISDDQQDVGVVTTEPGIPHLPATATTVVPSATSASPLHSQTPPILLSHSAELSASRRANRTPKQVRCHLSQAPVTRRPPAPPSAPRSTRLSAPSTSLIGWREKGR